MFRLDEALRQWRKSLSANPSIEDGYIVELEVCIRDEIAELAGQGISEEEAFRQVVSEAGSADDIGLEFHKAYSTRRLRGPSWKPPRFVPGLIWNSFKIAGRLFRRNKFYSSINIFGLAAGFACCLLIFVYVLDELNYDAYHKNSGRIYRIAHYGENAGQVFQKAAVSAPMGKTLVENFPEVENAVRFRQIDSSVLNYKQKSFVENRIIYSDPEIFEIFTLPLTAGNPQTALKNPNGLIMSEKTAFKYFEDENPIGKTVMFNSHREYQVTGVFKEIPRQSHFHFDVILSMSGLKESWETTWLPHNFNTYVLLTENADPRKLEAKLPELTAIYIIPEIKAFMGEEGWRETESLLNSGKIRYEFYLQPLRDIHLRSDLVLEMEPNGDTRYIQIFSLIAVFILIIAAINFINLSTARSALRVKEVGLRKVSGASRNQLIRQFLLESLVVCYFALFLAFLLVFLSLPYFNHISGMELTTAEFFNGRILPGALVITLLTCLIGGTYPAFFLSGFSHFGLLKGQINSGRKASSLRRILVVFQFSASILLIIATFIVFSQLHFMLNKNLGFEKEQVLVLEKAFLLQNRIDTFKYEVLKHNRVTNATVSGFIPVRPSGRNSVTVFPEGKIATGDSVQVQNWIVDYDYIPTLGIKISGGRNFSKDYSDDVSAAVINKTAAERFGWADPIGKSLGLPVSKQGRMKMYTIIGMVEDFHFESFRDAISPMVLFLGAHTQRICFRIATGDARDIIDFIRIQWERFAPQQPFEYAFMDERFDVMYRSEKRTGKIIGVFSVLAVLIGGLGLAGLAGFTTEQRTKEIGIRKVVGAKASEVVIMVCMDLIKPVITANLFAWPLAFYVMNRWLQRFTYRIPIEIEGFVFAAGITIIFALITVSRQAVRAAAANPIKSLRYE